MSRGKTTEEEDLETIRKGFEMFDVEGTGRIFPDELLDAMDSINMRDKNPYIYEIISDLCEEKEFKIKGGVSLDELVNYVYNKLNNIENDEGIRQNYNAINNRDTDTISLSTFDSLAREYGDKLEENEIRDLLAKTEMGGEELTYEEFSTIMKGAKHSNKNNKIYNLNNNTTNIVSSKKSKGVYEKKTSGRDNNSISNVSNKNSIDINKRVRSKYLYNTNENQKVNNPVNQEKEIITTTMKTTTINIKNNGRNINDENIETILNETPKQYSYHRVKVNQNAPKYDPTEIEKHIIEKEILNDDNINVNEEINYYDNMDMNNEDNNNYTHEKETKYTRLPDGTHQVEVIERTEGIIEDKPVNMSRVNRYENYIGENDEETKSQKESKTVYKVRRPRNNFERSDDNVYISKNLIDSGEKTEGAPRRYHRRYREYKTFTADTNEM